ncbi:MAG: hypothetical protein ACRDTE_20450 [Pseudonocardiaceae bacterium]
MNERASGKGTVMGKRDNEDDKRNKHENEDDKRRQGDGQPRGPIKPETVREPKPGKRGR